MGSFALDIGDPNVTRMEAVQRALLASASVLERRRAQAGTRAVDGESRRTTLKAIFSSFAYSHS